MNDKLNVAVDVLLEKLEEQEHAVIETKKMINSLLGMMGENPRFLDADLQHTQKTFRPDMFYGKPLATAAREFLELRGTACFAEDILKGLSQGGFDFEWNEKDRLRNMAISISKNSLVFQKIPNGMIGLLIWYPEAKKKRQKVQNNSEAIEEISEQEEKQEENEQTI